MPDDDLKSYFVTLDEEKAALLAMPESSLRRPRVDREWVELFTDLVVREMTNIDGLLEDVFSPKKVTALRLFRSRLPRKSDAFYAASILTESPFTPQEQERLRILSASNRANDRLLTMWGTAHFEGDPKLKPTIDSIKRGSGLRDDCEDVVRWVEIFRTNMAAIENKTPITVEQLDQSERDALETKKLLGLSSENTAGSPLDLRRRSYSAWESDYNELVRAGRFILGDTPEAEAKFPKVNPQREEPKPKQPEQPPT